MVALKPYVRAFVLLLPTLSTHWAFNKHVIMLNLARTIAFLALAAQALAVPDIHVEKRQGAAPAPAPATPAAAPAAPSEPVVEVPADAKKLPKQCQDILVFSGMTAAFKASPANTGEYLVQLKISATATDVATILALPVLKGVKAINTYTKEYDRGFTAKLSYEQVCALDKEARVSHHAIPLTTPQLTWLSPSIKISIILVCNGKICAPETAANTLIGPSANSGLAGAPDVSKLPEQCARVVWYTVTEYAVETIDPGKYEARTKVWVTRADADAFFAKIPGYVKNEIEEDSGYYSGSWTHEQLCEIEKSPLVSFVVLEFSLWAFVDCVVNRFLVSLQRHVRHTGKTLMPPSRSLSKLLGFAPLGWAQQDIWRCHFVLWYRY
jgi:hypothetical protein